MIYIGAAQACDAQAIMRAQMNKRVRAVTTTEWQRASEVSLMMSSSEDPQPIPFGPDQGQGSLHRFFKVQDSECKVPHVVQAVRQGLPLG